MNRLLGRQGKMKVESSMRRTNPETWSDRLINRDNSWLVAISMEDDGNLFDAIKLYLKDAVKCLNELSLVRAALSCSCAATCLATTGNSEHSCALYRESASIYEENAETVISSSIREALWSLQQAYEHYLVADDFEKAQNMYDKYMQLAKKINPLFGLEEQKETLEFRRFNSQVTKLSNRSLPKRKISSELIVAMEDLLRLRQSAKRT